MVFRQRWISTAAGLKSGSLIEKETSLEPKKFNDDNLFERNFSPSQAGTNAPRVEQDSRLRLYATRTSLTPIGLSAGYITVLRGNNKLPHFPLSRVLPKE